MMGGSTSSKDPNQRYSAVCFSTTFYRSVVSDSQTTACGTTSYGEVTSYNSSEYPTNGEQDGYWYVLQ